MLLGDHVEQYKYHRIGFGCHKLPKWSSNQRLITSLAKLYANDCTHVPGLMRSGCDGSWLPGPHPCVCTKTGMFIYLLLSNLSGLVYNCSILVLETHFNIYRCYMQNCTEQFRLGRDRHPQTNGS